MTFSFIALIVGFAGTFWIGFTLYKATVAKWWLVTTAKIVESIFSSFSFNFQGPEKLYPSISINFGGGGKLPMGDVGNPESGEPSGLNTSPFLTK